MPLPSDISAQLSLPAIAAPMFLVSGPDLVVAACTEGVIGTFPSLNCRTNEGFSDWLTEIAARLQAFGAANSDRPLAPYGVNLISHRTNERLGVDLDTCVAHKVPLVITSKGNPADVVRQVHSYGGRVFHDVINIYHAKKALEAGVDGLILVCAGAGGHAGTMSPFALLPQVREFYDGVVILAGCINDGRGIRAAEVMGADLAYIGTRFVATTESMAVDEYKTMLLESNATDVLYSAAFSGVHANALIPSIRRSGLDPDTLPKEGKLEPPPGANPVKPWKDVWSCGQGVGGIHDIPTTGELIERMRQEYGQARGLDRAAKAAE